MARVVVDVMLKPEILDPQGKAVARRARAARARRGWTHVRQGKRFEIDLDGELDDELDGGSSHELASTLLSNPVIEEYRRATRPAAVKIGVVTFPGSLDDRRRRAGRAPRGRRGRSGSGTATRISIGAVDAVVLPGGFSYGDYLRCRRDLAVRADHGR